MSRKLLPNRRPCITTDATWQGQKMVVSVGFYPDTGEPAEVFACHAKNSFRSADWADACVGNSIALQHGVPVHDLTRSLCTVPFWDLGEETDAPASPIGTILAVVEDIAARVQHA